MALRVLLADESVTIKKVIQLALQDFAVEVKAVPVGVDVLEVSKSFQPDLVFADILLQKRTGYEVCADLKGDPTTAAIPVVLMWSSFMELDQRQVDSCGADGRLEKPFEVEALRKLVLELVPRTRSQRLAHFLDYPSPPQNAESTGSLRMPPPLKAPLKNPFASSLGAVNEPAIELSPPTLEFTKTPGIPERPEPPLGALPDLQLEGTPPVPASAPTTPGGWNMDSFEPLDLSPLSLADDEAEESFKPIQLPQAEPATHTLDEDDSDADQWANRSLDKYRLAPLKPDESLAMEDVRGQFDFNENEMPSLTTDKTELISPPPPPPLKKSPAPPPPSSSTDDDLPEFSLSDEELNRTTRLEIEPIEQKEKTRPAIVHELLRDPDFSYGDETVRQPANDRTSVANDGPIDLGSAGRPSQSIVDSQRIESILRSETSPHLEKLIEQVIEKTVAQLLPQIAERIIKRELERLLEET